MDPVSPSARQTSFKQTMGRNSMHRVEIFIRCEWFVRDEMWCNSVLTGYVADSPDLLKKGSFSIT